MNMFEYSKALKEAISEEQGRVLRVVQHQVADAEFVDLPLDTHQRGVLRDLLTEGDLTTFRWSLDGEGECASLRCACDVSFTEDTMRRVKVDAGQASFAEAVIHNWADDVLKDIEIPVQIIEPVAALVYLRDEVVDSEAEGRVSELVAAQADMLSTVLVGMTVLTLHITEGTPLNDPATEAEMARLAGSPNKLRERLLAMAERMAPHILKLKATQAAEAQDDESKATEDRPSVAFERSVTPTPEGDSKPSGHAATRTGANVVKSLDGGLGDQP